MTPVDQDVAAFAALATASVCFLAAWVVASARLGRARRDVRLARCLLSREPVMVRGGRLKHVTERYGQSYVIMSPGRDGTRKAGHHQGDLVLCHHEDGTTHCAMLSVPSFWPDRPWLPCGYGEAWDAIDMTSKPAAVGCYVVPVPYKLVLVCPAGRGKAGGVVRARKLTTGEVMTCRMSKPADYDTRVAVLDKLDDGPDDVDTWECDHVSV